MKHKLLLYSVISILLFCAGYVVAHSQQQDKINEFQRMLGEANGEVLIYNMRGGTAGASKSPDPMDKLTSAYMRSIDSRASLLAATSFAAGTTHYDRAVSNKGTANTSTTDLAIIQIAQNQRIIELLQKVVEKNKK